MLKQILVPLDGSELAEEALEYASQVVGTGSIITLLTVVDVPDLPIYYYYPTPIATKDMDRSAVTDELVPQAQDYLDKVASGLQERGFEVNTEVHVGEAATIIADRATTLGVDARALNAGYSAASPIRSWDQSPALSSLSPVKSCNNSAGNSRKKTRPSIDRALVLVISVFAG